MSATSTAAGYDTTRVADTDTRERDRAAGVALAQLALDTFDAATAEDALRELVDMLGLRSRLLGLPEPAARHRVPYADARPVKTGRLPAIEHGTTRGYRQHRYRHEEPCAACLPFKPPPRPLGEINHGTPGGYNVHRNRGEKACEACLAANRDKKTAERRKRSAPERPRYAPALRDRDGDVWYRRPGQPVTYGRGAGTPGRTRSEIEQHYGPIKEVQP